jgi:lipopolysaccharide exporter
VSASSDNLGRRTAKGAAWGFSLNVTNRILGLARTAVLARLLGPEQYGLFGIAMLYSSILETVTQAGLSTALIQKKEDPEPYLDTAWVWCVARGGLIGAAMLVGAPWIGAFFRVPQAVGLIRVLSLTAFLGGAQNIAVMYFRRDLRMSRFFVLTAVSGLVDVVASLVAVIWIRSAYALAIGLVARYVVSLTLSYALHPFRPRWRFEWSKARELMSYGRWITGSTILRLVYGQGDDALVGRMLGAGALGVYQVGYKYSNLATTEVSRVIHDVALPAYSRVQDDLKRLRKAYLEGMSITALASIGVAGAVWALAPDFISVVLGPKWAAAVPVMRILAVWGASESVSDASITLFQAAGRPSLGTRLLLTKTILLAILIYPLTASQGLVGTCLAVVASSLIPTLASQVLVTRVLEGGGGRLALGIAAPSVAAVLAGLVSVAAASRIGSGTVGTLATQGAACLAVYAAISLLIGRTTGWDAPQRAVARLRQAVTR